MIFLADLYQQFPLNLTCYFSINCKRCDSNINSTSSKNYELSAPKEKNRKKTQIDAPKGRTSFSCFQIVTFVWEHLSWQEQVNFKQAFPLIQKAVKKK